MALVRGSLEDSLTELQIGSSKECLVRVLDAQRALFHSQIDQLQKIVIAQCKVTGVNPLSQEMAAGALSIKIGKKPRDLLNPKAIKYMQSIFSIKDTISKKEIREISALCGVTVTQVREFFASQRSRVRKLVRLSREKATNYKEISATINGYSPSTELVAPISNETDENAADHGNGAECSMPVPINTIPPLNAFQHANQTFVVSTDINSVKDSAPCASQNEVLPGIDSDDRRFLENIFTLMKKEETFSGQVKLMQWILQIHNSAVLQWFLTKSGIMILATWLNQAALEEQTTVLLVIFKVLCHLPLHKALPAQMSAILQNVNKLRFYRTPDISNKARVLLSRWSKMFVRSQVLKRSANCPGDARKEMIRKKRISEILSDESWLSKIDLPEDVLSLAYEAPEHDRKPDSNNVLKMLPATSSDSNKKQARSVAVPKTKERRKVLLVEQPDHKPTGRSAQVMRATSAESSRPISADDIQKAKMRAIFMQRKYGYKETSSENHFQKTLNQKSSVVSRVSSKVLMPNISKLEKIEEKKAVVPAIEASDSIQKMVVDSKASLACVGPEQTVAPLDSNPCSTSHEVSTEKLKRICITWQTPAVMKINGHWRVGSGENSKEMEVQTARIKREKETFYLAADDIPANPKNPWDMEMDFDDSLTPEIPTEPPPEADGLNVFDGEASTNPDVEKDASEKQPPTTSPPIVAGAPGEPDLELLAALLKNPELVFALTSGGGNSLSNADTMALLDVLKRNSGGLPGMLCPTTGTQAAEPPTSLPSPTPASERTGMLWAAEPAPRPQVRVAPLQHRLPGTEAASLPLVAGPASASAPTIPSLPVAAPVPSMVPPPSISPAAIFSAAIFSAAQLPEIRHHSSSSLPLPGTQLHPIRTPSLSQIATTLVQHSPPPPPELVLPSKRLPSPSRRPSLHGETMNVVRRINGHVAAASPLPPLLSAPPRVQPPLIPETAAAQSPLPPPRWPSEPVRGSWQGQNGLLEAPPHSTRFCNDRNDASYFVAAPRRAHSTITGRMDESDELFDRSELEPWSPERSPLAGSDYPSSRGYPQHRRGEPYGRSEMSRHHHHPHRHHRSDSHRDRHRSSRRWRERDRDRRG